MNLKPMLNAYPDSLGGTLGDIVTLLKQDDMQGVFGSFYILPSCYTQGHTLIHILRWGVLRPLRYYTLNPT